MQRSGQKRQGRFRRGEKHDGSCAFAAAVSVVASAQEPAKTPNVLEGSYLSWRSLPASRSIHRSTQASQAICRGPDRDFAPLPRQRPSAILGRITGTEADSENARWLEDKFRKIGLSDVRQQSMDLPPQWQPASWSVAASAGGKPSPWKARNRPPPAPAHRKAALDLEAVDVALASEGDLAGRDLRGKAVFFYSADYTSRQAPISDFAIKRISERGPAAIFVVVGLPGNCEPQFYPVAALFRRFSLGLKDGMAIRDLIGQSRGGQPARVKIRLDVKNVPNLKTRPCGALCRERPTRPFMWLLTATDGSRAPPTMVRAWQPCGAGGIFRQNPQEQRRRTIYFLGTSGHHDNSGMTGHWLADHQGTVRQDGVDHQLRAHLCRAAYLSGKHDTKVQHDRPIALVCWAAARGWCRSPSTLTRHSAWPPMAGQSRRPAARWGPIILLAPSLQLIEGNLYWHSDRETAEVVPSTGLAASTRAYAKIIADVNQVSLKDLQRPPAKEAQK